MKNFLEYREFLNQQVLHLIINNEADLLSFTKFLLNYGKVALKYFPQDVEAIAQKMHLYGFKEEEIFTPYVLQVQFKDQKVYIKTKDNKIHQFPLKSVSSTLPPSPAPEELVDLLILLSISLENTKQETFQIVNFALNKKNSKK